MSCRAKVKCEIKNCKVFVPAIRTGPTVQAVQRTLVQSMRS